jgi:hypothetical protein
MMIYSISWLKASMLSVCWLSVCRRQSRLGWTNGSKGIVKARSRSYCAAAVLTLGFISRDEGVTSDKPPTKCPGGGVLLRRPVRRELAKLLRDSPSLRDHPAQVLTDAYRHARGDAAIDTGLPLATFPEPCPWPAAQVLDKDFWPEGPP